MTLVQPVLRDVLRHTSERMLWLNACEQSASLSGFLHALSLQPFLMFRLPSE